MSTLKDIENIIAEHKAQLKSNYGVKKIGICWSCYKKGAETLYRKKNHAGTDKCIKTGTLLIIWMTFLSQ